MRTPAVAVLALAACARPRPEGTGAATADSVRALMAAIARDVTGLAERRGAGGLLRDAHGPVQTPPVAVS